jgi:hypothetical protein
LAQAICRVVQVLVLSEAFRVQLGDLNWKRREMRIRGTKTAANAMTPIVDRCGMAG